MNVLGLDLLNGKALAGQENSALFTVVHHFIVGFDKKFCQFFLMVKTNILFILPLFNYGFSLSGPYAVVYKIVIIDFSHPQRWQRGFTWSEWSVGQVHLICTLTKKYFNDLWVDYGRNLCYSWDMVEEMLSLAGSDRIKSR